MNLTARVLEPVLSRLSTPSGQRWFERFVWTFVGVGLLAALLVGANRPADPHLLDPAAIAATAVHSSPSRVAGFNQVGFRVIEPAAGGPGQAHCGLLADTQARQQRGMMGRHDFAGYDAMVFRFDGDSTEPFYNKDVPIPLTVAWFDAAGIFISAADLALCSAECPTVAPPLAYRLAVEVPRGGLGHLGVHAGTLVLVGGACP